MLVLVLLCWGCCLWQILLLCACRIACLGVVLLLWLVVGFVVSWWFWVCFMGLWLALVCVFGWVWLTWCVLYGYVCGSLIAFVMCGLAWFCGLYIVVLAVCLVFASSLLCRYLLIVLVLCICMHTARRVVFLGMFGFDSLCLVYLCWLGCSLLVI